MGCRGSRHGIQEAYLDGRKDDAAAAVPTSLIEEIALIGTVEKIRDDLEAWRASRATTMLLSGDLTTMRAMAELILGQGRARPSAHLSTAMVIRMASKRKCATMGRVSRRLFWNERWTSSRTAR